MTPARRAAPGSIGLLLVALAVSACGPKAPPAVRPGAPASIVTVATPATPATLRAELDRIFGGPAFARMQWAVYVQSLDSGAVLYERNPTKLMMPASNMKVVTLAAAAERLGWDYRYKTTLAANGPIEDGVLRGDLVVAGTGDPTINDRGGANPTAVFEAWAERLRALGIHRIDGRVLADARAFDDERLGMGWSWDDLGFDYAAEVSALQYNEDVAEIVVRPAPSAGDPAGVEVRPAESGLLVDNRVTTAAAGSVDLDMRRLPGSNLLRVSGAIPVGSAEVVRKATVDDPSLYFVRVLRATLVSRGIAVTGDAAGLDPADPAGPASRRVLFEHQSPPLSQLAVVLMRVSQNLYAETLVKTMAATAGGTAQAGLKVVRDVLTGWGIAPDAYLLADGSGLSRYNYVCAEMLAQILRQMYRDPRHREAFQSTLPVGGQAGGTIARRFKGTRAEGNVRAKTGTLANVRALSGYVTSLDGEPLVFSILANGFTQPVSTIDAATDLAVERLANLTRRKQ